MIIHPHISEKIYNGAAVSVITCDDRMGGGWGIYLHHTWGSGRGQPDAHAASTWIQVRDVSERDYVHAAYGCIYLTTEVLMPLV